MKIGVISDIHANLYSLMETYSSLEKEGVDTIICLGDIVGYGPHPNEAISFIRRKQIISLKGVYDLAIINNDFSDINESTINNFSVNFTREELTKSNLYYLHNLPLELNLSFLNLNIKFVHKNPYNNLEDMDQDILIHGYDHIPNKTRVCKDRYILSPGSCGKPSSGIGGVTCGILEISNNVHNFKILRLEHSFSKIYKDMKMMNFPEILINAYELGDN